MLGKFPLGKILVTHNVDSLMSKDKSFRRFIYNSIKKYRNCDWGSTYSEDKAINDEAVKAGNLRIHGVYIYPEISKEVWIITEADRSATTILFPEEY